MITVNRPTLRAAMPFERACLDKWNEGRPDDYADWRGEHPLIEAHEEVLDLWNYLNKTRRLVPNNWCSEKRIRKLNRMLVAVADEVTLAIREAGLLS